MCEQQSPSNGPGWRDPIRNERGVLGSFVASSSTFERKTSAMSFRHPLSALKHERAASPSSYRKTIFDG
jgi:hypothetical protein